MNREEKMTKLNEIKVKVTEGVSAYNELFQEGKNDEAIRKLKAIEGDVNEYTSVARELVFDEILDTEDPMIEAIKRLTFETIAISEEKRGSDDDSIPIKVVSPRSKNIDVLKLQNYSKKIGKGTIGKVNNWDYIIQKFNFLMTVQKATDLGINPTDIKDSYDIAAIAKEIDMGKTPTSKTNILKTLQKVVNAMIGEEYKVTSHDVNFLMSVYSRKNKAALTVSCANHRFMRQYVCEICNRIINNDTYKVAYKAAKKD